MYSIMNSVVPCLIALASIAIVVAVCVGVRLLLNMTKQKGIQITSEAMDLIERKVYYVVKYVNQTVVDAYKRNNPDARLTDEQANEVKILAKNILYNMIDMTELDLLLKNMNGSSGDESNSIEAILNIKGMSAEEYIDLLIEAAVSDTKNAFLGTLIEEPATV